MSDLEARLNVGEYVFRPRDVERYGTGLRAMLSQLNTDQQAAADDEDEQ